MPLNQNICPKCHQKTLEPLPEGDRIESNYNVFCENCGQFELTTDLEKSLHWLAGAKYVQEHFLTTLENIILEHENDLTEEFINNINREIFQKPIIDQQ